MTDLRTAAQAVLDRWDSPAWEWLKQGPTAALMADLRAALAEEAMQRLTDVQQKIQTALAEPMQEPVAKVELMTSGGNAGLATRIVEIDDHLRERLRPGQLLYTAPLQRKPLTEEEIEEINRDLPLLHMQASKGSVAVVFARAIERAHGIGGSNG